MGTSGHGTLQAQLLIKNSKTGDWIGLSQEKEGSEGLFRAAAVSEYEWGLQPPKELKKKRFLVRLASFAGLSPSVDGHWGTGSRPGGEGGQSSWRSIQIPSETAFAQIQKKRSCGQGPGIG